MQRDCHVAQERSPVGGDTIQLSVRDQISQGTLRASAIVLECDMEICNYYEDTPPHTHTLL